MPTSSVPTAMLLIRADQRVENMINRHCARMTAPVTNQVLAVVPV